jgi:integrase
MTKGIYKRGNIYWIRYAGLDGKMLYESSCSSKFRDAETLLIKRKQTVKEGKQPEIKKIAHHSFKELAVEYSKWAERQRSFNSKRRLILQVVGVFGNLPLRNFSTKLIEQYQTEKLQIGNRPATVNRHLALIKHMFTKAVEWDMVEDEALKRVRRVKLLQENNRRLRFLSKEECRELINACSPEIKPIVITALNTGMRKGEILGLKWDNVDLKHGFIMLEMTKNGERKEVPINDTLRRSLQSIPRRLDIQHVFIEPRTNKPYQNIKKSFSKALRIAKVADFRFHDLRHTFASHLVMSGVDITTVKELLGHKTLTMTLRYAHLSPTHKKSAVDLLDSTMNENTNYTKTIQSGEIVQKKVNQKLANPLILNGERPAKDSYSLTVNS